MGDALGLVEQQGLRREATPRPAKHGELAQLDGGGEVVDETGDLTQVVGQSATRISNARIVEGNDGVSFGQLVQKQRIPGVERTAHTVGQYDGAA
ncbi:hypothetical protein D3C86_1956910 [compost metagenome]